MSGTFEQRLRQDLAAAVEEVRAPDGLAPAVLRGGRRRLRRRRALVTAPVAVAAVGAVVAGAAGGWDGRGDGLVAAPAPSTSSTSSGGPTGEPVPGDRAERAAGVAAAAERLTRQQEDQLREQSVRELTASGDDELAAWFGAGYVYDDAVRLGEVWSVDAAEAKVLGGEDLLAGRTLPVSPSGELPRTSPGWELNAFTACGYSPADAEDLAAQWDLDTWDAQVEAGRRLLAGEVLPVSSPRPCA
ncbi:hypothetical protein [Kineococcus sp. SYSU DK004]|uniref:hypothetical protein n=1 Tax=Kineococcus sp. SYSU DK004 TaxID=3383125 RepID=UPI003D7E0FFD